ncbi:MAG: VWA domain-containing protein [SAR202 cluster bacterium]|nr:VWA domain-containing protein [SAR202 cluster bacterium]
MDIDRRHRYGRWDGTQNPWDMDESALMEEMADDLISHGDVRRALRDLFQRGMRNPDGQRAPGLRDLKDRLQQRRQQQLQRYNLDSVAKDLKERLDDILKTEREGIQKRVDESRDKLNQMPPDLAQQMRKMQELLEQRANDHRGQLDRLPQSLGGQIKELQDYDFMDPDARSKFQELMDELRKQMMQNVASDMKQRIQQMTPEDMAAMREMLRDLNQMMRDKMNGKEPNFNEFMRQWGSMFGDNPPESFDELMQRLAEQMGQMQSLLDSMSPEQRRELFEAMNAAMDPETAQELAELSQNLGQLMPMEDIAQQYPFMGKEDLTLDQAMQVMEQMQDLDQLEDTIEEVMRRGDLDQLDPGEIERLLGEDARRDLERLRKIAKQLEDAGYLKRNGDKLDLTPAGIRKIGMKALKELFAELQKSRQGNHDLHVRGSGGEHTDETKPYEFGDPMEIHLQCTVMNAVQRTGTGTPVRLSIDDFEVMRTEHTTQAATVLLLDQSRSMGLFGSFTAAKKVAMALHALIHSRYPRDEFYVLGFSDYAVKITGDELPKVTWNAWVSGTNMQHAFMMSRQLLNRCKGMTKQIIMITDGEPTAYVEGDRAYFSYPPSYKTIQETLKEARRCTQDGIVINTFMLETSHYLLDFVDRLTKINHGRALYTTPDQLGQYVIVDYLTNRKQRVKS